MAKNPLKTWFEQNDGKGWIDCKTGKPCGRKKGEKRRSYPACRPTKAQCTAAAKKKTSSKRISWKDGRTKKEKGDVVEARIAKCCGKVMSNRRKLTKFY